MERRIIVPLLVLGLSISSGAASASTHPPAPEGSRPLGRFVLDRELESSHATLSSFHFLLRYPKAVVEDDAQFVIEVLESELQRLRTWIPIDPGYRRPFLEVLLFSADDFEEAYGPAVIGLYDGRLRLPITSDETGTGVHTSTLTHELTHALVAEHSGFAAPFWFQEGLAQYLEPDHAFPDRRLLVETEPLPLAFLDEVLTESEDPVLLERAYRESAWAVHFLAIRDGISGIRRLLAAYAEGATDKEAFRRAFQASRDQLERELDDWYGRGGPGPPTVFAPPPVIDEPAPADFQEWYGYYEKRVRPIKSSLRRVVEAMRGRGAVPAEESCPRLAAEVEPVFSDWRFFECPDEEANLMLFDAFRHIENLALSCEAGDAEEMRAELDAVERSLELTAYLLEPYGLAP